LSLLPISKAEKPAAGNHSEKRRNDQRQRASKPPKGLAQTH